MTTGIIGLGTMGSALAAALRTRGGARVIGTDDHAATARAAAERLGIELAAGNKALARESDVVVLCVKPHQARAAVEGIAPELGGKLLISICAAVTTGDLRAWSFDRAAVVRAMPNTPALIGAGMTVLAPGAATTAEQLDTAVQLFGSVGRTAILDETLMDAATGLSGCGPAYVFLIVEALSDAAVKLGIDRATAVLLASQTLLGSAQLILERGVHPAVLKDQVTTPGGCTIDGLVALEDGGLRSTLIAGVVAAANRSRTLRGEPPLP
jgi:pyrroline-5-carboxylate reductase